MRIPFVNREIEKSLHMQSIEKYVVLTIKI